MANQAQSPISEAVPITAIDPPKPPPAKVSDLERIKKQFPEFDTYIESVITKYQQFHPSGVDIAGLTEEERMKWWGAASCIVKEFEQLRAMVVANTTKRD